MAAEEKQPSVDVIQRLTESDDLINEAYDLALDPKLFHQFAESWLSFSEKIESGENSSEPHRLHEAMTRHFERAFLLLEKMGRQYENTDPVSEQVAQRSSSALELNRQGQILFANRSARNSFRVEYDQRKSPEFVWQLFHKNSETALRSAIQEAVYDSMSQPIMVLQNNGVPCLVLVKSVGNSSSLLAEILQPTWSVDTNSVLATNYQLTGKECEIVAQLHQGLNARAIASATNKSQDTVRTQIRSILRKMNCDTQAHLMRLLTSIVLLGGQHAKTNWFVHSGLANYLKLVDGREIEYYDIGDPAGETILVFHGIMHTPELNKPVMNRLVEQGYRIVGFCRAGYGNSSPPKSWDTLLADTNADAKTLLAHLKIEQVSVLALMGGSVFAYNFATEFGHRVTRVIAMAGVVPLMDEEHIKNLPASAVALIRATRWFPKLVVLLVRSAVALVDQGDTQKIAQLAYRQGSIDYLTAISDEHRTVLAHAYRFTSHQGHKAYANNGVAVIGEHLALVAGLDCPVVLIHGQDDEIQPIENVRAFAESFTHVSLCEIPDSGQLVMFSQPELVTEHLLQALNNAPS